MRSTPALAFGISGDGEDVRIVQAVRKLRGLEFIVRFKPGRTRPDELRALHAEIENLQTRGRALLAAALPASATGVFALSASLASPGKARKVWPSLLDLQLPFPVAECRFVVVETRPTGTGQIAGCAVVARREALGDFLRGLAEQRLDPIRLDCEGLALWSQSLMECPVRDPNQPVVVACISSHRSVLAVGLGTRFQTAWSTQGDLFARDGDWEARQGRILRALRSALGTPERPVNWRWTGSRADDLPSRTTAQTWLESALGATEWTLHRDPDLFLARALARRALQPDRWACSFRTGDLASPIEKNQRRRQTFRAALGCAIVGVLLLAANGILGWQIRRIETRSRDLLNRTACQISGAAFIPRGVEERTVREAVERQETQREPMERVFRPPLIASLRAISIAAREDSMQIEQMDLADSRIEIFATTAKSMETDHLRAALESLGYSSTWNPAPEAGRPGRIRVIAEKVR